MYGSRIGFVTTVKKVAADQIVMAPFLTFGIIILGGLAQGKSRLGDLKDKIDDEYVEVMLNRWKLWPAAQMVNFYFVPYLHRPIFTNVVAIFWNTYLAWRTIHDHQQMSKSAQDD